MARRPGVRAQARAGAGRRSRENGFDCEVELGDRTLLVDLPTARGRSRLGAAPGAAHARQPGRLSGDGLPDLGRAPRRRDRRRRDGADCEYDERGQLGVGQEVAVGWQRIALDVRVTSAAPEDDVRRVVADRRPPQPDAGEPLAGRRASHRLTIIRPRSGDGLSDTERAVPPKVTP